MNYMMDSTSKQLRRLWAFAAAITFLCSACDSAEPGEEGPEPRIGRGATVSVEKLADKTAEEIRADMEDVGIPIQARFPVTVYKVVYETVDTHDEVTIASGALLVPKSPTPVPLLSLQHGTVLVRTRVPSSDEPQRLLGMVFATGGYIVSMPDLLGLGDSPGLHPYVHAKSSATAVVDMLRASSDFVVAEAIESTGQLFLIGYSQGGYTAMAAHRALETEHADEFTVTASAPMAGPYDLSGTMAEVMTSDQPHPAPYYLAYALIAYNEIYELHDSPSRFLKSPYDTTIPPMFDGTRSGIEINRELPEIPRDMLNPMELAAFEADPDHPFRQRLRENDLYDWAPQAPIRMYHCSQDTHVSINNSEKALSRMLELGADVELVNPLPVGDHFACAFFSLTLAKNWLDTF